MNWTYQRQFTFDPTAKQPQRVRKQPPAEQRAQVVKALLKATEHEFFEVRAASAMALGRMSELTARVALDRLTGDAHEPVRLSAYIAMGLLDSAKSEQHLLAINDPSTNNKIAQLYGLGLTSKLSDKSVQGLRATVRLQDKDTRIARTAMWGLRHHVFNENQVVTKDVLKETKDLRLGCETILALGQQKNPEAIASLSDILLATPVGQQLPAYAVLDTTERIAKEARARLKRIEQRILNNGDKLPKQQTMLSHARRVYQERLRSSAAIALGHFDHPDARQALRDALTQRDDEFSDLHKGMAIMSLGQIGDGQSAALLMEIADYHLPNRPNKIIKGREKRESPLRGYAALALGLYVRQHRNSIEKHDQRMIDDVSVLLAETLNNRKDTQEMRAACALALGLAKRDKHLVPLQRVTKTLGANDDLLIGYIMMARGMLGDRSLKEQAFRYLELERDKTTPEGILGRRAAVIGLGLLRDRAANDMLKRSWEANYYVVHETALAFAIAQEYSITPALLDMLAMSKKSLAKAFACESMGFLYTDKRPPRTCWFTNGGNYMMRDDAMRFYQMMGNEFLFRYLVEVFGDQWI